MKIDLATFCESYDWREAFAVADPVESVPPGTNHRTDKFRPDEVAEVIAAVEGENDGDSWVGVFRLSDGRFVTVSAWCDYTGWGCQDGGHAAVAATKEDAIRFGLDDAERARLGLTLDVRP